MCPSLPGFTHGFYPGKPGLGFKPYFEKVGTKWVLTIFDVHICVFYSNLTDKKIFFFSLKTYTYKVKFTTNVYFILHPLKFHDTINFKY